MCRIIVYYIRNKGFTFNVISVSHFWLYGFSARVHIVAQQASRYIVASHIASHIAISRCRIVTIGGQHWWVYTLPGNLSVYLFSVVIVIVVNLTNKFFFFYLPGGGGQATWAGGWAHYYILKCGLQMRPLADAYPQYFYNLQTDVDNILSIFLSVIFLVTAKRH